MVADAARTAHDPAMQPTIYLAGPAVFEPDPDGIFSTMKAICVRHGVAGLAPIDNQEDLAGLAPGPALMHRIVAADIALMQQADAGVFCLDGFRRGPEMDPGTAFEIGYMHALGKPLAGWTRDVRLYPDRVRAYFSATFGLTLSDAPPVVGGALSGTLRDPDGILVHSETCLQNAMTTVGIERSGGRVHADPDWTVAFDRAVATLSALLTSRSRP